ncbi:sensor histidine kinase [Rufibacter roseus]|uniref:Sensor histidine kinase n=1 Tax=Rufibacter roseus TaxID=1567108 RepID=A0ABW2DQ48_9BACT|nr:sensor histidine kinase [Rufibacter roseus]
MLKSEGHMKSLWKIALITSVAWGVVSIFPLVNAGKPLFLQRRPLRVHRPPNFPFEPSNQEILLVVAGISLLMFSLWFINMYLYGWVERFNRSEKVKNSIRYVTSYLLTVGIYYGHSALLLAFYEGGRPRMFPLVVALTNNTIILVLMDLLILQRKSAQIAVENSQLKMNHAIAQHQHLKHQLQPHFLFNSLNTLKSLIKKQRPEAEEYLVRLSDLLRASITGQDETTIPLKEELKLCVDYLEMQKVRFKYSFSYIIDIPEPILLTGCLPIFSLQLLVENAIKHNAFTVEEPLTIRIAYRTDDTILVWNNKKPKQTLEPSSGIGLKNLMERYQVISGHGIKVIEMDKSFSVELKLIFS